ncbi:kinase-like protein [Epithele typhae]|uniref:kinase-like protein n=1 Tax=Epithele typhae TaxID=378194 RepID=UPI0020072977|nr:kinase-like protein [Epithele typhae]KAH9921683.1 kinase-like protein [Epithele typhae]
MSLPWHERKSRLSSLIGANDGEDGEAVAMDQLMHGQSVIGKTAKTIRVDEFRFTDKDLDLVGTLEYGQYGVIDVVTCKFDGRVYVRKSTEKRFALRTREQCSPQFERDILLKARKMESRWAPHLLCAFQTPTHLNLVMEYIEGGTLWDVLESSPHDGKIIESDLKWWIPQIVSAISWCHSQGFAHRDVKPHNFVLDSSGYVRLIDFGSTAPLLPPAADGSQAISPEHCQVPCGTCDYISPEILQAHEEALVALEMDDEESLSASKSRKGRGYGRETDWWSMGAMIYEMAYGVAPFFSREIRHTYARIVEHHRSLKFDASAPVSVKLQDLLRRLLTSPELRLGRCNVKEIQSHSFFSEGAFEDLHLKTKPDDLHVPQFTYATPVVPSAPAENASHEESQSRPFAFSMFFQSSSPMTAPSGSPGVSPGVQMTPSHGSTRSILREQPLAAFIGFSWGPPKDAFDHPSTSTSPPHRANLSTPRPLAHLFAPLGELSAQVQRTPVGPRYPFATPVRPSALTPFQTLPRASTVRRTAQRRVVSDREAMKQLVDCVGMSARKKVLESGRKPRVLLAHPRSGSRSRSGTGSGAASVLKELRFDRSVAVVGDAGVSFRSEQPSQQSHSHSHSHSNSESMLGASILSMSSRALDAAAQANATGASANATGLTQEILLEDTSSEFDSDAPPSPSPTPRPGSAMSMLSRRSATPTGSYFLASGQSRLRADRRSLSPSFTETLKTPRTAGTASSTSTGGVDRSGLSESRSIRVDGDLSYGDLDNMERRYKRLMGDIAVVEARLDEVAGLLQ